MVEPGTAAIAVLSTIAGISGYGAMKVNSKQDVMIEAEIQRRIQGVRDLLRATEAAKATAERSLSTQQSEVARLASELRTIKAAKEALEREKASMAAAAPVATQAVPPPTQTQTATRTPAESFLNAVPNLTAEADLRDSELKAIEDIIAQRLREAEADKSTEGKIVIGRLKKAANTAKQARDRVKTVRVQFKDTVASYDRKVRDARRTLRAFRKDPEDVAAAQATLRLPPTEVQEEVSSALDDAGAVKVELDKFLQGKTTTPPSAESLERDVSAIETGVLAEQRARKEQRKAEERAAVMDETPPPPTETNVLEEQRARKQRRRAELETAMLEENPAPRVPSRRSSRTSASTPRSVGGKVRKNKLRTRRGDTQNGRGTRRRKNRANRTHSNAR
jgi:hypothetical protein